MLKIAGRTLIVSPEGWVRVAGGGGEGGGYFVVTWLTPKAGPIPIHHLQPHPAHVHPSLLWEEWLKIAQYKFCATASSVKTDTIRRVAQGCWDFLKCEQFQEKNLFSCPACGWDSSIPTPVTDWLTHSLTDWLTYYKGFYFLTLQSNPRDLWPLRPFIRVTMCMTMTMSMAMSMTMSMTMTITMTRTMTMTNTCKIEVWNCCHFR